MRLSIVLRVRVQAMSIVLLHDVSTSSEHSLPPMKVNNEYVKLMILRSTIVFMLLEVRLRTNILKTRHLLSFQSAVKTTK